MKKYLLFALTLLTTSVYSQTIIMEEYGGVYKIPCRVNGAKMKMIFDTGASKVSLSMTMADYLYENDYITDEDILGTGQSSVADGSIVNHVIINLRDIEIAGLHLTNVQAVVIEGQNAPLLLGQSAIQKLGKVTIQGNVLTIGNNVNTAMDYDAWMQKAVDYYNSRLYRKAYDAFTQAAAYQDLDDYYLLFYAWSASKIEDYASALKIVDQITDYQILINEGFNIYWEIGFIYLKNGRDKEVVELYKMAYETIVPGETKLNKASYAYRISLEYSHFNSYALSFEYIEKAINEVALYYNTTIMNILYEADGYLQPGQKSIRTLCPEIDTYVYEYYWVQYYIGIIDFETRDRKICNLARNGNKKAILHTREFPCN